MSTEHAPGRVLRPAGPGDPRVTVAVITRDRSASLLRTLDVLAALPERPPVIVVDNSRDDTTSRAVAGHPAIARLLRPAANTGALGRNLAVRHARTPYVAFSDDDSWWEPGSLRRAADLLDRYPRLGLLAARTLVGEQAAEDPSTPCSPPPRCRPSRTCPAARCSASSAAPAWSAARPS